MRPWMFACCLIACSPELDAHHEYRSLARELNPILVEIRPVAIKMQALSWIGQRQSADDREATFKACTSVDAPLLRLHSIKNKMDTNYIRQPWLADAAGKLTYFRWAVGCGASVRHELYEGECLNSCYWDWSFLILAADSMRDRAKRVGVEIVSLKP